jgi:hypothetical protein
MPIAARDLYHQLRIMAELDGKLFVKTPQALAQRLRSPHIVDKFMIETSLDRDRKIYRIVPALTPESVN